MKTKLVFWTAFNSYQSSKLLQGYPEGTVHPARTEAWTRRRVELFRKFNLPSILAQTHKDFVYVVLLDPELRHLTEPVLPEVGDSRVWYCYDDKPDLKALQEYDELVLALIDSDDMYAPTAGEIMMACPDRWMYFKRGYALEERRGRFWHYNTIGTGPFFARRIDPKTMTCFDRDKRHPTHKAVIELKPTVLPSGQFCVLIHDQNTSSRPDMRYVIKKAVDPAIIREKFGFLK